MFLTQDYGQKLKNCCRNNWPKRKQANKKQRKLTFCGIIKIRNKNKNR